MLKLTLKPDVSALRLREAPVNGKLLGQISPGEIVESVESTAETRRKLGADGQWLQVRRADGLLAYCAGWLLAAVDSLPDADDTVLLSPANDGLRLREAPVTGNPIGQVNKSDVLTSLEAASITASKVGAKDQWLRVRTAAGVEAYAAAWLLVINAAGAAMAATEAQPIAETAPKDAPSAPKPADAPAAAAAASAEIGVRALKGGLRLRVSPVDGEVVAAIGQGNILISLEDAAATQQKLGTDGQWLKVKTIGGVEGYAAAWLLGSHTGPIPRLTGVQALIPGLLNTTGMNLDVHHPLGTPDPARLRGMGWVRFGYSVSAKRGSEDIDAAYNLYKPHLERYARAGFKVLLVFTHETYGEGKNEFWPWSSMTTSKWGKLTARFAEMVGRIAAQYAGKNIVHAYQVWNEMDAPTGAEASVPIPPQDYGHLLAETIRAIRRADPAAVIITGGHTSGPQNGSAYARATLQAMPAGVRPDGVAFHPYGRGTKSGPPYAIFGHIDEEIRHYAPVLPGKPVWMTEWGVLDRDRDRNADILTYATDFVRHIKSKYPDQVAAMIWYAWAMSMHNGYGLVNSSDQPLQPLNDGFRAL